MIVVVRVIIKIAFSLVIATFVGNLFLP
jgi:hypothetical protein